MPIIWIAIEKKLQHLLHIEEKKLMKQDYVASLVSPYIDHSGKPRLIEPPKEELKRVQKRLKNLLSTILVPNNVFSGIKGKSYVENALLHVGQQRRNVFKIDFTAFFPSIRRETVYRFFHDDLQCSPDISNILCNFTTIDLMRTNASKKASINDFLQSKRITCTNHLMSGAPTSQKLSYLVNHRMFDEMQSIADNNHATMTIYVDDVTFSSEERLSNRFKKNIISIVSKYGYKISKAKVKLYSKAYPKVITGVVVNAQGKPAVKNSLQKRIIMEYKQLLNDPHNHLVKQRLRGRLSAARQVDPDIFPTICALF